MCCQLSSTAGAETGAEMRGGGQWYLLGLMSKYRSMVAVLGYRAARTELLQLQIMIRSNCCKPYQNKIESQINGSRMPWEDDRAKPQLYPPTNRECDERWYSLFRQLTQQGGKAMYNENLFEYLWCTYLSKFGLGGEIDSTKYSSSSKSLRRARDDKSTCWDLLPRSILWSLLPSQLLPNYANAPTTQTFWYPNYATTPTTQVHESWVMRAAQVAFDLDIDFEENRRGKMCGRGKFLYEG